MKFRLLSLVPIMALASALPAAAQEPPPKPPTAAELSLKVQGVQSLLDAREKELLQTFEAYKASEARAKWAVGKLWKLPEEPAAK